MGFIIGAVRIWNSPSAAQARQPTGFPKPAFRRLPYWDQSHLRNLSFRLILYETRLIVQSL